jgi:hypothetical protein
MRLNKNARSDVNVVLALPPFRHAAAHHSQYIGHAIQPFLEKNAETKVAPCKRKA